MTLYNSQEKHAGLTYVSPASFAQTWCAGQTLWLRPIGIVPSKDLAISLKADCGLTLAGGYYSFTHLDLVTGNAAGGYKAARVSIGEARQITGGGCESQLSAITASRPAFAGLPMDRVQVMGIVNVTPDSFSDGGQHFSAGAAIAHGRAMVAAGATLLDVGGESTRPGSKPVEIEEELGRITPVITALARDGIPVSADTRHKAVMGRALASGARIINDVSGFIEEGSADLMGRVYATQSDAAFAIAMHMQGEPQTMQNNPEYGFAPIEVFEALRGLIDRLVAAGLPRTHIAVDPGFGFGKTPAHNAQVVNWTSLFHGLGVPVMIGVSRKSSIPKLAISGGYKGGYGTSTSDRLGGSLALVLAATAQGAQVIRSHDIAETVQAVAVQRGIE